MLNVDPKDIIKQLKGYSKKLTYEDLDQWNATSWSHLVAIASGLPPFKGAPRTIIPQAFQAFLPKSDYTPSLEEQRIACKVLKKALTMVNSAILEATKHMYANILQMSGGLIKNAPDIEQVLTSITGDLFDYNRRKEFFATGLNMMSSEEAWTGRHHLMGVGIIFFIGEKPDGPITEEEFTNLATDVGILVNGKVEYDPLNQQEAPDKPETLGDILKNVFKQ